MILKRKSAWEDFSQTKTLKRESSTKYNLNKLLYFCYDSYKKTFEVDSNDFWLIASMFQQMREKSIITVFNKKK